jgi:hypothetical protein
MKQSPSSEANSHSSSQEVPRILWNPKVYSQEPNTDPYPETDESSQHLSTKLP